METICQKLDTDYRSANKVFWQIKSRFHGKRTVVATFMEDSSASEASKRHPKLLEKILLSTLKSSDSSTFRNTRETIW